jgi:hypothetical protein
MAGDPMILVAPGRLSRYRNLADTLIRRISMRLTLHTFLTLDGVL